MITKESLSAALVAAIAQEQTTIERVARNLDVTFQAAYQTIKCKRMPNVETLDRYARAIGCRASDILREAENR